MNLLGVCFNSPKNILCFWHSTLGITQIPETLNRAITAQWSVMHYIQSEKDNTQECQHPEGLLFSFTPICHLNLTDIPKRSFNYELIISVLSWLVLIVIDLILDWRYNYSVQLLTVSLYRSEYVRLITFSTKGWHQTDSLHFTPLCTVCYSLWLPLEATTKTIQ